MTEVVTSHTYLPRNHMNCLRLQETSSFSRGAFYGLVVDLCSSCPQSPKSIRNSTSATCCVKAWSSWPIRCRTLVPGDGGCVQGSHVVLCALTHTPHAACDNTQGYEAVI